MIGKVSSQLLYLLVITVLLFNSGCAGNAEKPRLLLFQPTDAYVVSFAIVSPIELQRGGNQSIHRTSMNTGFALSYALPYKVSHIHSPTYWSARSFMDELTKNAVYVDTEKEAREAEEMKKLSENNTEADHKKIKRDITAGEFYNVVKESFELSGFDEQCVLKSICELAKVPFHQEEAEEEEENLLHELFHLVLTPSIHQAFDDELENEEKRIYEEAEMIGKTSGLCDQAYPKCHVTPLHKHSDFFSLNNF